MGLFSSREKTSVGTSVSRVIEDDALPDSPKIGIIKALREGGSIPAYLMQGLVDGIGVRAERMYAYAGRHYTYGLPSGEIYYAAQGREEVLAVLRQVVSTQVTLEYSRFGPANALHMGWLRLVNEWGYDSSTNEITRLSAERHASVYLKDMVVTVPAAQFDARDPKSLEQWGLAPSAGYFPGRIGITADVQRLLQHTPVRKSAVATQEYIRVYYAWQAPEASGEGAAALREDSFDLALPSFNANADYFHAKYFLSGKAFYWMYEAGAGTHPQLDHLFNAPYETLGEFFPFGYFRYNKTPMSEELDAAGYKSTRRMLKHLGMDYQDIIDAIHESPDIADVEQAMLFMAVPATTSDPTEQRYLFDFFDRLHTAQTSPYLSAPLAQAETVFTGNSLIATSCITIQDARFKMALTHEGLYKRRLLGAIGAIGTHASEYGSRLEYTRYEDAETHEPMRQTTLIEDHTYRKQISSTVYEEITVRGLRMTYFVYGGYTTAGTGDKDTLLVPIDRTVTASYPIPDKERLYARSLHYVFNSRVVTEVAWYQEGWFQAFVMAVAVVVTAVSMGAGWAAMNAALIMGTISMQAVFLTLAIGLLKAVLVSVAAKLFVKAAGEEFALIAAVVVAAYAAYTGYMAGSLAKAPWAQELLSASTNLTDAVGDSIQARMGDLQEEAQAFGEYAQAQNELIEKAQDLLETNNLLSPLTIIGEEPKDYYQRTIHAGNVGLLVVKGISSFVKRSLTLPTPAQTLGATFNGLV